MAWAPAEVDKPAGKLVWADEEDSPTTDELCNFDDGVVGSVDDGAPSVGSRLHDRGTCKPCVFFHTKGCKSGKDCVFCHRCPPYEKQRRKRVSRNICNRIAIAQGFDGDSMSACASSRGGFSRAGHSRQNSTSSMNSTGASSDGLPSEWSVSDQLGETWDGSSCSSSYPGLPVMAWDPSQVAQAAQPGHSMPQNVVYFIQPVPFECYQQSHQPQQSQQPQADHQSATSCSQAPRQHVAPTVQVGAAAPANVVSQLPFQNMAVHPMPAPPQSHPAHPAAPYPHPHHGFAPWLHTTPMQYMVPPHQHLPHQQQQQQQQQHQQQQQQVPCRPAPQCHPNAPHRGGSAAPQPRPAGAPLERVSEVRSEASSPAMSRSSSVSSSSSDDGETP